MRCSKGRASVGTSSSSSTGERAREPKGPSPAAFIACTLELGMLGVFAGEQSLLGAAIWLLYFYFSATRALVYGLFAGGDD